MATLPYDFWDAARGSLVQLMLPIVRDIALAGAKAGFMLLPPGLFAPDWALVNKDAAQFAEQYTYGLVQGITDTTRARFQATFAAWVRSGLGRRALVKEIAQIVSRERAQLIATTEVTRAYAEGNTIAWQASGLVEARRWRTANDDRVCPTCGPLNGTIVLLGMPFPGGIANPPGHPGCRCWITPVLQPRTF